MAGRSSKRKLSDEMAEDAPSGRSSRARKKTAKVLEMEAFEEEIAYTGKGSRTKKKPTTPLRLQEGGDAPVITPNLVKSPKTPPLSRKKSTTKSVTPPANLVTANLVTDMSSVFAVVKNEEPEKKPPPDGSALKLMLTTSVKQDSIDQMPDDIMASHSDSDHEIVPKIEEPSPPKVKTKKKTSKKSKATNSAITDSPNPPKKGKSPKVVKTPEIESPEVPEPEDSPLIVAEKPARKKAAKKKVNKKVEQPVAYQPELLNFESEMAPKMEMLDYSDFVDTVTGVKEEEVVMSEVVKEEEIPAVAPPTVKKKKVAKKKQEQQSIIARKAVPGVKGKTGRGRKAMLAKADKTPKRRTTAYTLWCNDMRKQLMIQYPDTDFAQISRKLAELWQTVSVAEKNTLRRRAKKIQKKQDLGQDVSMNRLPASTHMRSGQAQPHQVPDRKAVVYTSQSPPQSTLTPYNYKVTGNDPVDVAAHLKLLGESLGTIGARLQEHRGQIAVQGSLSVLLDSMLCALGPLMCLTNQVPELDSVHINTHKRTLDNIAYIMPGIG